MSARPQLLVLVFSLSLLCGLRAQQTPSPSRPRPANLVLVVVDDLGWSDPGFEGQRPYPTPHIDRLAAEGFRFSQAYAACAVCSPSRAAILSGRYPARLGITDWIRAGWQRPSDAKLPTPGTLVGPRHQRLLCPTNSRALALSERTLAEVLKDAGYRTAHIGKWHLGGKGASPQDQGFDENYGGCDFGQPPSYHDPFANRRLKGIPGLPGRKPGQHLSDRETEEALGFIERNAAGPFFLHLAHYAVHTPIQPRKDLLAEMKRKLAGSGADPRYAALVVGVDLALGRVMAKLRELELDERTLVIFTSDNGGLLGPTRNAPLRAGKGYPYEGGLRVPLVVRWPKRIPAGAHSATPICGIDLFPSALGLLGIEDSKPAPLDGVSFHEHLLSGGSSPVAPRALFWHFPHYRGRDVEPWGVVRQGRWKLVRHDDSDRSELFDLARDPGEGRDLSAARPKRCAEMSALLEAHRDAVGARRAMPNPEYRPRKRVLLLGDSISMGYTAEVRRLLREDCEVHRPMRKNGRALNCSGTTLGARDIDSWLAQHGGRWDLIHFNFGLHDLKREDPKTRKASNDPNHPRQAEPERYEAQLRRIVARLKATGARLIFATTTPVPEGVRPHRDVEDPARYNAIARKIMAEHGIAIDDLYAFALPRLKTIQRPRNVHFHARGSRALAAEVARSIRRELVKAR